MVNIDHIESPRHLLFSRLINKWNIKHTRYSMLPGKQKNLHTEKPV